MIVSILDGIKNVHFKIYLSVKKKKLTNLVLHEESAVVQLTVKINNLH